MDLLIAMSGIWLTWAFAICMIAGVGGLVLR